MKILVVDDSSTIRKILKNNLLKMDVQKSQILEAVDGLEAVRQITNNGDIGLVITDLSMPNMDGLEFIKRVRRIRGCDELAVVVISGTFTKSNRVELGKLDIHGYIEKPFNAKMFLATLSPILDGIANPKKGDSINYLEELKDFSKQDVINILNSGFDDIFLNEDTLIFKNEKSAIFMDIDTFTKNCTIKIKPANNTVPKSKPISKPEKNENIERKRASR